MDPILHELGAPEKLEIRLVAMAETLFSTQWYRVAHLCPKLRPNVVTHRHYYRGTAWYVVSAKSTKSQLRINSAAFYLFTQFDGERTVDTIWQAAISVLKEDAPSQDEVVQLLSTLFDASAIDFQRQTDLDQLFENHKYKRDQDAKSRYWNPLFLRFSIFDPDQLARKALRWCRWGFTRGALTVWLILLLVSCVLAGYAWDDLSAALNSDLVSSGNLVILWFVFPIMKLIHELAHAMAVKRWGGEVHEFGIALLVLLPVPYVDASDSASFSSKYRRMAVAGAGIIVESTLACLGLLVWLVVEPGLVRDVAFNVLLTGSVSSILFNGNPLLKFDSYYVLADAIEIPSLASRSKRYLLYLMKRYLFGADARSPATGPGERRWLIGYGLLSTLYRLMLTVGICLFVAGEYFFIGVALAIWALVAQLGLPLVRGFKFLLSDPSLAQVRLRANAVTALAIAAVAAGLFVVQVPHATQVRGIVWPPDEAMVRADADCLVENVLIDNGISVDVGTALINCDNTLLQNDVVKLRAELMASKAGLYATKDRVERTLKQSEIKTTEELLARAEVKLGKATLRSAVQGELYVPGSVNLTGNYFAQGALVGYVLDKENISIRTMLAQEQVALLRDQLQDVEVRLVRSPDQVLRSKILRTLPAATERLVIPGLGVKGGGNLVLHPDDRDSSKLYQAAFEVELQLPKEFQHTMVGDAVEVRFDHGADSIASLLLRQLQLLLLRRFNV
jgi:putative peptide zinc metalloprotease protein